MVLITLRTSGVGTSNTRGVAFVVLVLEQLLMTSVNVWQKGKESSMARSLKLENLPPQNVGSIINYLQ